jgi:hypothetical protein
MTPKQAALLRLGYGPNDLHQVYWHDVLPVSGVLAGGTLPLPETLLLPIGAASCPELA